MSDSPIRIAVELEGIEPNARFQAACDELVAAAAELVEETTGPEVVGHFTSPGDVPRITSPGDVPLVRGVWADMRPGVKGFNIGMPPTRR